MERGWEGVLMEGHFKMFNWIEFIVKILCLMSSTKKGLVTFACKSSHRIPEYLWEVRLLPMKCNQNTLTAPAAVLRTTFHYMKTDEEFG